MTTPIKPSRLDRALELAGYLPQNCSLAHAQAVGIVAERLDSGARRMGFVALANVLLRLVDLDEREAAASVAVPAADQDPPLTTIPRDRLAGFSAEHLREIAIGLERNLNATVARLTTSEARCKELEGQAKSYLDASYSSRDRLTESESTVTELRAELLRERTDGDTWRVEADRAQVSELHLKTQVHNLEHTVAELESELDQKPGFDSATVIEISNERHRLRSDVAALRAEFYALRGKCDLMVATMAADRESEDKRDAVVEAAREYARIYGEAGCSIIAAALSALDASRAEPVGERAIVVGSVWRHGFGHGEREIRAIDTVNGLLFIKVMGIGPGGWLEEQFRKDFTWVSDPPAVSESATGEKP